MFASENPFIDLLLRTLLLGPLALIWVSVFVRLNGLRTFSKLTSFDFIATVATGSLLATAATRSNWPEFFQASGAMVSLLLMQSVLAKRIQRSRKFDRILQNEPVMLMRNGQFERAVMQRERVSEDQVWSQLRAAGVTRVDAVQAVVLETSGDFTVVPGVDVDPRILASVKGAGESDARP